MSYEQHDERRPDYACLFLGTTFGAGPALVALGEACDSRSIALIGGVLIGVGFVPFVIGAVMEAWAILFGGTVSRWGGLRNEPGVLSWLKSRRRTSRRHRR